MWFFFFHKNAIISPKSAKLAAGCQRMNFSRGWYYLNAWNANEFLFFSCIFFFFSFFGQKNRTKGKINCTETCKPGNLGYTRNKNHSWFGFVRCYYFTALLLTYFTLTNSCITFFDTKQLWWVFRFLMVSICKIFFNQMPIFQNTILWCYFLLLDHKMFVHHITALKFCTVK